MQTLSFSPGPMLNLGMPSTWNPMIPVLLPLGAPTISPVIPASMGIFTPFFIFVCAFFWYLFTVWRQNTNGSGDTNIMPSYRGKNNFRNRLVASSGAARRRQENLSARDAEGSAARFWVN